MGCHPSHWRTHIFQDCYCTTNQVVFVDFHVHHVKSSLIYLSEIQELAIRNLDPLASDPLLLVIYPMMSIIVSS